MTEAPTAWVERIVEEYSTTLLRIAMQQMKNRSDAEDVVQTVLLKLLRAKPEFKSPAHEKAWLIRVTVNACHDEQRLAHRKRNTTLEEWIQAEGVKPETEAVEVLEAVRRLDEKYSSVIYLYYYEGYTTAEIAEILGTQKGTVDTRLFRAREQLRKALKGGWD